MGGHLGLRLAKSPGRVKIQAIVEFFAPINKMGPINIGGLGNDINRLPPVQIHHGEDDEIVPPEESKNLEQILTDAGKENILIMRVITIQVKVMDSKVLPSYLIQHDTLLTSSMHTLVEFLGVGIPRRLLQGNQVEGLSLILRSLLQGRLHGFIKV